MKRARLRYDTDMPLFSRQKRKNPNKRGPINHHERTEQARVTPHSKPRRPYNDEDKESRKNKRGQNVRDRNRRLLAQRRDNPFTSGILRKTMRDGQEHEGPER